MISLWPCRTGVLVVGQIANCGFSMLPWDDSFLCALDASTGSSEGDGLYVRKLSNATIEGAFVATENALIAPQGRVPPRLFSIVDGSDLGSLGGGGGSFVTVANEKIYHGPGNKTGWITVSDPVDLKAIKTYHGFNEILLAGDREFRMSDNLVTAWEQGTEKLIWQSHVVGAQEMILAGSILFGGGRDQVVAIDTKNGKANWRAPVEGVVYEIWYPMAR
jgi:outer membrane protein assembly factor BamB